MKGARSWTCRRSSARKREFDIWHGWTPKPNDPETTLRATEADLIGMMGEMGEFANIIKKVALEVNHYKSIDLGALLKRSSGELSEELIDAFIYLIRIASHLKVDMEQIYHKKLAINEQRFKRFENTLP